MANSPTQVAMDEDVAQDAQMELKRRARRRLLGAAALALLAVVVLPMVMDHEPRPPAQDIQVRIPSQDSAAGIGGEITSRLLPGKGSTPLPPAAEPKVATAPARAEPPVVEKPEPGAEVRPENKPVAKTEPPVASAKAAAAKPAAKVAVERNRAETALSGEAESAAAGGRPWIVQLGAYKDALNVKTLTGRLKGLGVPSYTEKFDSPQGPRTRVRAGPFATKEAAEKAQAKAKAIGVNGSVAQK